ncbi:iron ABC transporter substrate-binding protein [Rhodovibrio salinarum]|uniref:iron ABC transporter substrate-binding protein n=1 Tax=Rhodovibrio salinarum TaxID=1087 RepID=UPI000562FCDB|nr:iron ABC transporter substrate-binding protein [Rhodovibrio salinarum]
MANHTAWALVVTGLLATGAFAATAAGAQQRNFTDDAGRTVQLPGQVDSVYPTGHPASILLYTLAPETLAGWTRTLPSDMQGLMPARYQELPVIGRLSGRGDTANLERVLTLAPDVLFDYGAVREPYISAADRLMAQTGLPTVLLGGRFDGLPASYRKLGQLLGKPARADRFASYARETLALAKRIREQVLEAERPRVYYGRDADGLTTAFAGSLNAEILSLVGARNVADDTDEPGLGAVNLEQILAWNPEVIVTINPAFYDSLQDPDGVWSQVQAVQQGRVYLAPERPFGWFDRPPSVNRLIGVRWLLHLFYPERMPGSLRGEVVRFYELFYHVSPSDTQLDRLLVTAMPEERR